jgi:hypothetical protein
MNRIKWDAAALGKAEINESDAEFLSKYGLPNLEHDELVFSTDELAATIASTDCHRIGTYGILNNVPLFVRESTPGVWTIDEDTNELVLVNSSARAFAQFIALREKYLLDMGKLLPPKVQQAFVSVIKSAMEDIDLVAFAGNSLWGPFMEDVGNQAAFYDDEF